MTKTRTRVAAVAAAGVLGVTGLAACGSGSGGGNASGSHAANSNKPVAQLTNLQGQHTQVILASSFLQALQQLKVKPGTIGSASLATSPTPTLTFPITGGNVTYYKPHTRNPYVLGAIDHDGSGLSLTAGGTTVKLTNFVVDPASSKLFGDVEVGNGATMKHVYLFFLNGSTLQPLKVDKSSDTAVLYGTKVYLSSDAAKALNTVYHIHALNSSVLVGTAKITVSLAQS